MRKHFAALAAFVLCAGTASALNIIVAPATGVLATPITTTIADAVAQINAGPDASNTITLRSTEGVHSQPANSTLTISAGKNIDFVAESGRPIIKINWTAGQYMLIISGGTGGVYTFTGLGFIPQIDLGYTSNVADGLSLAGTGVTSFTFDDCIFAANDGLDGLSSLDGSAPFLCPTGAASPFLGGRNVGDDWIQLNAAGASLTISNSVITGCNDDGVLSVAGPATVGNTVTINNGTVIANIGGAGSQKAAANETWLFDGTAGRVLFAKCGLRNATYQVGAAGAAFDTGPKAFSNGGSFTLIKTDVIEASNGGVFDFGGLASIKMTDCRIALNNTSATATAANISISDITGTAGAINPAIELTNVTIHDAGSADSIFASEGATQPRQNYFIWDSIVSGAGDSFANMTNATNSNGPSPAPIMKFSSIVQAGTHAIATVGDLAGAETPLTTDPVYASLAYTIGRSQANADFLRPTDAAYLTASSAGGRIGWGGTSSAVSSVPSWDMF